MSERRGAFITFEGLDGSGKSTHIRLLSTTLRTRGFDPVVTAEPTRTSIGQILWDSMQDPRDRIPLATEALLFAADRLNHMKHVVEPATAAGKIVLSDRYVHSSLAYQGAQGLDTEWIRAINRFAPRPDLSIYLDITPELGLDRTRGRKKTDFEVISLQKKIREIYLKLVDEEELVLIDGNRSVDEVQRDVLETTLSLIKEKRLKPKGPG